VYWKQSFSSSKCTPNVTRACHKSRISPARACQKTCFLVKDPILHMLKWTFSTFSRAPSIQTLFKTKIVIKHFYDLWEPVLCAVLLSVRYVYVHSHFCPGQSSKCKNKQWAITLKLGTIVLRFLYTALLLNEIYLPTSLKLISFVNIPCRFGVMSRTKYKVSN